MIKKSRLLLILLIITLISIWFIFDLGQFLTLDYFKSQQASIEVWKSENPLIAVASFAAIYITVAALSLPGAAILTLAGGAIFGLLWGTVTVSFASTIGATLAFFVSRSLLHDWVQTRFGDKLKTINEGVEKDGAFYLFTLRLVPLFPFFVINLLMGLTPIRARTFYWVSQTGMLAATLVYVNAGTQLAQIESLQGILSPELLISFILLGLFPLLAQKALTLFKQHKIYAKWQKPSAFDNNLIPFKKFRVDYSVIPWSTFVEPEVARVGLNEIEAQEQGIAYEVSKYNIDDLDRAIADEEAHGMVKVLTVPGKDKILGVTIVGEHAGDLIAEYVMAMKHNIGLNKILGTIHIYPTMAEANKYVAGNWKRAHTPEKILQWVERFHAIRRRTSNKEVELSASDAATEIE